MKVEFKQKHTEHLLLDELNLEQFLAFAIESSKQLGWVLGNVNENGFIAYTTNGLFASNAEVKIKIINGLATLQSQSIGNEIDDIRQNKKNVQQFISTFNNLKYKFLNREPELRFIISKTKIA